MTVNELIEQHKALAGLIGEIERNLSKDYVQQNAFDVSLKMSKVFGVLNIHLLNEDKFFYPKLLSHQDAKVKSTAERFHKEVGGLAQALDGFKAKYGIASKIKDDPQGFVVAAYGVFNALKKRVVVEEKDLYPLYPL